MPPTGQEVSVVRARRALRVLRPPVERRRLRIGSCTFLIALCTVFDAFGAKAQSHLVLDGSLPNGRTDDLVATQAGPIYSIDETMGAADGGNLFHSFLDFSIGPGDTARFLSAQPFDRVLLRVTGNDPSTINGALQSSVLDASGRGADFFFLNPNGILFGAGSSVDVPANLYLSTADQLRFAGGTTLDSRSPTPPILTDTDPVAFGFLGSDAAAPIEIVENSTGGFGFLTLRMAAGTTLAAIGGDVRLSGPSGFLLVEAPSGKIALIATGSSDATVAVDDFSIASSDSTRLGTVLVESGAIVETRNPFDPIGGQGEIVVRGGRFELDGGFLNAGGNGGGLDHAIELDLAERVDIEGGGVVLLNAEGLAPTGRLRISAPDIRIDGVGSSITTRALSDQPGGDVELVADRVSLSAGSDLSSSAERDVGNGGGLSILADSVRVEGGATIRSSADAQGEGGAIQIVAETLDVVDGGIRAVGGADARAGEIRLFVDETRLVGSSTRVATTHSALASDGIALTIGTGEGVGGLSVTEGAAVIAQTDGDGAGSAIEIRTGRLAITDGGGIQTGTLAGGNAGEIAIRATDVEVGRTETGTAAGSVSSTAEVGSLGRGGNVSVEADAVLLVRGGQVSTETDAAGDAGSIEIRANRVRLQEGGSVRAAANGGGDSGDISLVADEEVWIGGFDQGSSFITTEGAPGASGNVDLIAPRVEIRDGALVNLSNFSDRLGGRLRIEADSLLVSGANPVGQATRLGVETGGAGGIGGIDIDLTGNFQLTEGAILSTLSESVGRAGDIDVSARSISVDRGGLVIAEAIDNADAGFVTLGAIDDLTVSGGSTVSTSALQLFGGTVTLEAGGLLTLDDSTVRARVVNSSLATTGDGGDVLVNAPFVILNDGSIEANAEFGDGGDILIDSQNLLSTSSTVLDASSLFGSSGAVVSTSPAADLTGQIENLATDFENVADRLRRNCGKRTERQGSFRVVTRNESPRYEDDDLSEATTVATEGECAPD